MDATIKPLGFRESHCDNKIGEFCEMKPSPPLNSPRFSSNAITINNNARKTDQPTNSTNNEIFHRETTRTDFGARDVFYNVVKSLDVNRYATKKTIAQGMLDIALLTANASQLKYILQVGKQHEFYTLMLTLISLSIGLQALVGILYIIVGGLDINRHRDHRAADIINDVILVGVFVISLTNIIISGFGIICIVLGSNYNINKTQDQHKANAWNNISLSLMLLTVAVNVIISVFEMRNPDPDHQWNNDDNLFEKSGIIR